MKRTPNLDKPFKMSLKLKLKIFSAIALVLGLIISFFEIYYEPVYILVEKSPIISNWLKWIALGLTSIAGIAFITLIYFDYREENPPEKS